MTRVPGPLAQEFTKAVAMEKAARGVLRRAIGRKIDALNCLREAGVPMSHVALLLARVNGTPMTVEDRQRAAARFRKARSRVTVGHRLCRAPSPRAVLPSLPSTVRREVNEMPQLIKRTTEEFLLDDDELLASDEEETDEDEESDEDPEPRRPKRIAGRK